MEKFIKKSKFLSLTEKIRLKNIYRVDKLGGKKLCRFDVYMHPIPKLSNKISALIFPNPSKTIPPPFPPRF